VSGGGHVSACEESVQLSLEYLLVISLQASMGEEMC
jgi:hypothetical protein